MKTPEKVMVVYFGTFIGDIDMPKSLLLLLSTVRIYVFIRVLTRGLTVRLFCSPQCFRASSPFFAWEQAAWPTLPGSTCVLHCGVH